MGFHLAVVPVQVPVEADGEGHAQDIQVILSSAVRFDLPSSSALPLPDSRVPSWCGANYSLAQSCLPDTDLCGGLSVCSV